jgi:hypothetical protein
VAYTATMDTDDADPMQDTEHCAQMDAPAAALLAALQDPAVDPICELVLDVTTKALEVVAASERADTLNELPRTSELDRTTVVADVPMAYDPVPLQKKIQQVAFEKGLQVCLMTPKFGQARLAGFLEEFEQCLGDGVSFDHVSPGSTIYNAVRLANVFIVDNADWIDERTWRWFEKVVNHVKFGSSALPAGKVAFILIGDDQLHHGKHISKVTGLGCLEDAEYCASPESYARYPTQHIWNFLNERLTFIKSPPVQTPDMRDHRDNVITVTAKGKHTLDAITSDIIVTSKGVFPKKNQVRVLSCYDVATMTDVDAELLYPLLAYRGVQSSPDHTPPNAFPTTLSKVTR